MTFWLAIGCDVCSKKALGLDWSTDPEQWLQDHGWDSDPEWGHCCAGCVRKRAVALNSDDQLEVATCVENETVDCKSCGQPIFYGHPAHAYGHTFSGKKRLSLPYNAKPHHCGYSVRSAFVSAEETSIDMEATYYKIGSEPGKPVYSAHTCRKGDIQKLRASGC